MDLQAHCVSKGHTGDGFGSGEGSHRLHTMVRRPTAPSINRSPGQCHAGEYCASGVLFGALRRNLALDIASGMTSAIDMTLHRPKHITRPSGTRLG